MRSTIKDIFAGWKKFAIILTLLMGIIVFTAVEEYTSFDKVANLQNQKKLMNFIADIGREDLEFARIQLRGKSTMLHYEHEKLLNLNQYDIIGRLLPGQSEGYSNDLEKLKLLTTNFTESAEQWYDPDKKELKQRKKAMLDAQNNLIAHINQMIEINIGYDREKFMLQQGLIYLAFLLMLLMLAIYIKRFAIILNDISSLYIVSAQNSTHTLVTEEASIISKRMSRKTQAGDNPAMQDPITEINNYKGLLYDFANKKEIKDNATITVCVFEIDNFAELDKQYPKSFTQTVLKKSAFMLSLYEQATDIIARTDYSQFAIILSRKNHEQILKDCQSVMQNVKEASFKTPKGENINLTLCAGLAPKLAGSTIDETIDQAREALFRAKGRGPNTLLQTKDIMY